MLPWETCMEDKIDIPLVRQKESKLKDLSKIYHNSVGVAH